MITYPSQLSQRGRTYPTRSNTNDLDKAINVVGARHAVPLQRTS
jgi:hypothetical protein